MAYKDLFYDGDEKSNTEKVLAAIKPDDEIKVVIPAQDLKGETIELMAGGKALETGIKDPDLHFAFGPVDLAIKRNVAETMSDQAQDVTAILIEALALFLEKNRGYGNTSEHLGARGQYADMHRKMGKLKHTLWDGNPAVGESVEEMCMDLIGHAALTINFLRGDEVR